MTHDFTNIVVTPDRIAAILTAGGSVLRYEHGGPTQDARHSA
jgi:hypothetical protein